jgi:predicted amidohydrolase
MTSKHDSHEPTGKFTAALVQMCSQRSVAANIKDADALVREAARRGARYIQTPENTVLMDSDPQLARLAAQPMDDSAALAAFRALARELGIFLHIGSIACRLAGESRLANRSVLISPQGRIIAWYDKIHMFDVEVGDGQTYRESANIRPGDRAVVAAMPFGRLGMSVCYDLRFPALYRALAKAGADLLGIPAAFTQTTGEAHWHVLLRARAIETGCYVLAAAQAGRHESGRQTYGHSLIVAPWGEVLADGGGEPGVITAEIDLRQVAEARRRIPALDHDRPFALPAPAELAEDRS